MYLYFLSFQNGVIFLLQCKKKKLIDGSLFLNILHLNNIITLKI